MQQADNYDSYNFCINDRQLNELLLNNYYKMYNSDKINKIQLPANFDNVLKNDFKYDLMKPKSIKDLGDKYELNFEISGCSNIYGSTNIVSSNTTFKLTELKNINKNDYAYAILYFPNYDSNMNKKSDYLLSTLIVGYCLKKMNQNYDLTKGKLCGTKAKVICMTTCDIDEAHKNILLTYYDEVKIVPFIAPSDCMLPDTIKKDKNRFISIQDVSKGNIKNTHGYYKVFTKLNIFNKNLFPYKKVILVDSDLFAMGYFDTLFSLNTPAGWLEHKRQIKSHLGVGSWIYDRQPYCKHGQTIPNIFTDIENDYAADINASLWVIEPNNNLFNSMINELKTPLHLWFGPNKNHKGFWLGNTYFDYYLLPEQNYLTKKLSGQWKSIDLGFSSWLIDLDDSFGFTFAGFIVKPWKVQSAYHKYSLNPISDFSKLNNKITQRSYGYQLLNNLIYAALSEIKNKNILGEIDSTKIIFDRFDPWEPEIDLNKCNSVKINQINTNHLKYLSYDQKKLVYVSNNNIEKGLMKKHLYFDYLYDNITRNILNLNYLTLNYKLADMLHDICKGYNIFPFNNTLISLVTFGMFDICDDHNDFMLIVKNKNAIYDIIEQLLKIKNLQVYICLKDYQFIKITTNIQNNEKNILKFNDFKNNFDFNKVLFFNYSFDETFYKNTLDRNNIKITKKMLFDNGTLKLPWIEVHYKIDNNIINVPDTVVQQVTNKRYKLPDIKKLSDRLSYYVIKSTSFKLDLRNEFNRTIIFDIMFYFKNILKKMINP